MVAASLATLLANRREAHLDVQWAIFWIDGAALAGFAVLWSRARRSRWLLFLTAIQLLAVCEHLAMVLDAEMDPRAYVGSLYVLFAGMLACLVWGARGSRHEPVA
ncbi:hypothetical protein ACETK8_20485 (plasmid) [Brevundimonas staleyi]|uniref:Uncharacterized protein n=1 Tax=Brevundimonas staleyi TaxID=74326 RepID=A0ABW0FRT8_9CAUL